MIICNCKKRISLIKAITMTTSLLNKSFNQSFDISLNNSFRKKLMHVKIHNDIQQLFANNVLPYLILTLRLNMTYGQLLKRLVQYIFLFVCFYLFILLICFLSFRYILYAYYF